MWDFPLQSDRIKSICSTYWNPHSVVTFDSPCRKQLPGRWSWVQLVDLVKVVACYEDIPIVHFHFYCNLTFLFMSTDFLLLLTVFFTFCRFNCSQLWSYRLLWTFCRLYVCLWIFPHHRFAALFRFVCLLAEKALLPVPSSRSTHARCSPTPSQQRASSRYPPLGPYYSTHRANMTRWGILWMQRVLLPLTAQLDVLWKARTAPCMYVCAAMPLLAWVSFLVRNCLLARALEKAVQASALPGDVIAANKLIACFWPKQVANFIHSVSGSRDAILTLWNNQISSICSTKETANRYPGISPSLPPPSSGSLN